MTRIPIDALLGHREPAALRRLTLEAMAATRREERLERIRAARPSAAAWLEYARTNLVAPVVAHALLDALDPGFDGEAECRRLHEASLRRMRTMLAELDLVAGRLARDGVRMVGLKNAGIARGVFPCAGCCPMGDLDVLVDRARFRDAHKLILESGFTLAARGTVEQADLEHGLQSGGTEYVKQTGGEEVWFELQWRPIAGRWIRRDQEPDGAALLARSVPIPHTDVRLLAPEDNLLQVALHTAKHTYVRAPGLRLHTDVDRLTAYAPPDWDRVVQAAQALDVRTAVYFSLACAEALLGTPIPDTALEALAPPAWKVAAITRWLRAVDVFDPDGKKFTRPAMAVFTALLYDDAAGLVASALDAEKRELTLSQMPRHLVRGVARVKDLLTRYQD